MIVSRRRATLLLFCAMLAPAVVVTAGLQWWRQELFPHRYGATQIRLPGGKRLYLKREVGSHYDRTALSLNADRCIGPSDTVDYVLSDLGAGEFPLHYEVTENAVTVYDSKLNPPTFRWNLAVKQERLLKEPHFGGQEDDYESRGISEAEVTLGELYACKR